MTESFLTLAHPSKGYYKEKGSKFLSFAYPVGSEEEGRSIIKDIRKKYFDARHHCYGYILGIQEKRTRVNDDGEPSGTAGKPILGQILSKELCNVLIVVVRYFGGTLLGKGGLIRAYKRAAADALDNGLIITKIIKTHYRLVFDYTAMNDIMRILNEEQIKPLEQKFEDSCEIVVEIPSMDTDRILSKLKIIKQLVIVKLDR
jgi:uncharacterized YigZ family protein